MSLADLPAELLNIAESVGGKTVTGNEFFIGAKALLGNNSVSKAWTDIQTHNTQDLIDLGITTGAAVIAAVDPALAPVAPLIATVIIWARHHPASTLSLAMQNAAGPGGGQIGSIEGVSIP